MTRAVREQLRGTGHEAGLKWPNDVLLDGGKLCGILSEVVPGDEDAVVVGVGVNTRMSRADLPVDTATSFESVGLEADEDRLLADFLTGLDAQLSALGASAGDAEGAGVRADVESLCTTIGSDVVVSLPDGTSLEGRATGIDAEGRLMVTALSGVESAVSAGDVVHVR
jgi:BirA family biotin operon repressor/biotin-[acetyl-CoA-carboxylase] ligase